MKLALLTVGFFFLWWVSRKVDKAVIVVQRKEIRKHEKTIEEYKLMGEKVRKSLRKLAAFQHVQGIFELAAESGGWLIAKHPDPVKQAEAQAELNELNEVLAEMRGKTKEDIGKEMN